MWGFLDEGGFLSDYKFSDKTKNAFNKYINPGMPLPEQLPEGLAYLDLFHYTFPITASYNFQSACFFR